MEVFATPGRRHTGRKDVDLPCDATEAQQRRSPPSHGAGLDRLVDLSRFARRILAQRSPLLGRRPVPQVGYAAAVEAQLVSLTSWSASPTGPPPLTTPHHHRCLVQLKIASDAPRLLGFAT